MGTELNSSGPSVWLQLSNAQHELEQTTSNTTLNSSETDFTNITATTQSSIRTTSSHRDPDLRQQYDQRPEKVPNIASEMEKWYAMTDRYGFLDDNSTLDIKAKEKEVERSEKWAKMSESVMIHDEHAHSFTFSEKFKKRVYKGIPDCWRREAWYYLVTDSLRNAKNDFKLRSTYNELLLKESSHERQIDLDIPRTLGDHIMFKQRYGSGQRALFNVLRAFANYDEEVGYCQGMTNIVATILMYCEEEVNYKTRVFISI
ncbi:rab-GTPase-TBC domain-containing protein [Pilaira anomala]|nr:rab-GTPase-TBC domain-containing protein [Pilaira anomala]